MTTKGFKKLASLPFPLGAPTWPDSVERPSKLRKVGLDYDNAWSRRYPARLVRAMVLDNLGRPTVRVLAPSTVRGYHHVEQLEGPVIFVANHASHLDTGVILTQLPTHLRHKTIVAAASDFFFDRTWKAATWSLLLGAIPIERTKIDRRSAAQAEELLAEGWNLVIFPEGGRTPDGWMQDFKAGAAFLSCKTGAAVVPIWLGDTGKILKKGSDFNGRPPGGSGTEDAESGGLHRHRVSVSFGSPLRPEPDDNARRFAPRIEAAVELLGREVSTDFWQARRNPNPANTRGPEAAPWRRAWAKPEDGEHMASWPKR